MCTSILNFYNTHPCLSVDGEEKDTHGEIHRRKDIRNSKVDFDPIRLSIHHIFTFCLVAWDGHGPPHKQFGKVLNQKIHTCLL